ncbi:hypothetical protein RclHR1_00950011 [Rhizophagus clarus]|uniref:F-box domain-containing protein n=1 Tax=Rhizophagus clarus TaxID=94130 RepID=A0A2Z6S4M1_9GLOM|nr:hypothetical protein RclHR1_00950011 [Rhizophagus clarus]GES74662.1 hypothetical protein GLOIN_2v1876445 [Rhizophagus clarus]
MSQLPTDCLNDIFEYLDDRFTLYSCILVSRIWCEISVKFFWNNSNNYSISNISILVACLPNESKEILCENGIPILSPTTKLPIFNYASFCKVLSINNIQRKTEELLKNQQTISHQILYNNTNIVTQEICKMFMKQIPSLKKLVLLPYEDTIPNFILNLEAKDCLKNLSELRCDSNISPEIFYQLSQMCHNISLLHLHWYYPYFTDGLTDLISVQRNLKHFVMTQDDCNIGNTSLSLITKLPNTLIKLNLYNYNNLSLSFITKFSNLQELELSFEYYEDFTDFEKLSYVSFLQLQILRFQYSRPNIELLMRFLENNGKNLKEFYVCESDNLLNLAISKFCTNLRKLFTRFKNDELETFKIIFKSCLYLKSIGICCGGRFLNEKEILEAIVKYSHENISEVVILHQSYVYHLQTEKLSPKELESFFKNWANRVPQTLLTLVIVTNRFFKQSLDKNEKNMKIIKKYIELGVIKDFKVRNSY